MEIKYRLSKVKVFRYSHQDFVESIYSFSHYKHIIEKKSFFGWKIIMDNICGYYVGMELLNKLKTQSD